jgi:hypothetical protein
MSMMAVCYKKCSMSSLTLSGKRTSEDPHRMAGNSAFFESGKLNRVCWGYFLGLDDDLRMMALPIHIIYLQLINIPLPSILIMGSILFVI